MSIMLKDNSPIPENLRKRCRDIQNSLNKGHYSLINLLAWDKKQNQESPHPQIINERGDETNAMFSTNYVGLFEYHSGNKPVEQVIIGDRFGPELTANGGDGGGFLSFFSWRMLESCWNDTPLWLLKEFRSSGEIDIDILDKLLMLRLASQLGRAWKKGLFRLYRNFSRYDYQVRGQLDIPRKIRMSMGLDNGKMAYRVREYSEDNIYNQLFLQACLEAEKRQPKLMRSLENTMPDYRAARKMLERLSPTSGRPDTRSLLNHTKKKITNPVYRDYEILRSIARVVLKRSSHKSYSYAESGAPFVTGIFLDISKLWEDYLANAVLPAQPTTQEYVPILKKSATKNLLNIKPDFWWKDKKRVLDAKYRRDWGKALNYLSGKNSEMPENIRKWTQRTQRDVYQVLAYMQTLNCTRGGVIFPVYANNTAPSLGLSLSDESALKFWLFPFRVPDDENYRTFSKAMDIEANRVHGEVEKFLDD